MLDDFPKRIADLLESFATTVRALTVDRIAKVIKFVTLGLVALTMVVLALIFLIVGLFRVTGELVHKACDCSMSMEITYAVLGGLFLVFAWFLWSRRTRRAEPGPES